MVNLATVFLGQDVQRTSISHLSPEHLSSDLKHKFGATCSNVFVVCCKCQPAREYVGLRHAVKSTAFKSSASFSFAGKGNNYSIYFASKMGIVNVFLTSLRGKKSHPIWLRCTPFYRAMWQPCNFNTIFFSLAAPSGFFLFNVVYSWEIPHAWASWIVSYRTAELLNKRNG